MRHIPFAWFPGYGRQNDAGEGEIGMIKDIEKLRFHSQLRASGQGKPLR